MRVCCPDHMGDFAILCVDGAPKFTVEELHVNIWCLWALGARSFICDVGIKLSPEDLSVAGCLELIAPFTADRFEDLRGKLLDNEIAELLFNRRVTYSGIRDGNGQLECVAPEGTAGEDVVQMSLPKVRCVDASSGQPRQFSSPYKLQWDVDTPPFPFEQLYLRARFYVNDMSDAWVWRKEGGLLHNQGALVDFRFNDLRDARRKDQYLDQNQLKRCVEIEKIYCFVIAPWELQLKVGHPEPGDVRVLEGDAWTSYLGRQVNPRWLYRRSKAVVYRFDGPSEPVSLRNPFSVFLDMGREPQIGVGEYLRIASVVALIVALVAKPIIVGHGIEAAWDHAFTFFVDSHPFGTTLVGIAVAVLTLGLRVIESGRKFARGLRQRLQYGRWIFRWVCRRIVKVD